MSNTALDWCKFFGLLGFTLLAFIVLAADLAHLSAASF